MPVGGHVGAAVQQLGLAQRACRSTRDGAGERLQPGQRPQQLALPVADDAGDADDLAPRRRRATPRRSPARTRSSSTKLSPAVRVGDVLVGERRVQPAGPTMSASSSSSVMSATVAVPRTRPSRSTVTRVGELADLGEPVGDVDDRGARGDRLADQAEQQCDRVPAQRGGRLVEDQQLRLARRTPWRSRAGASRPASASRTAVVEVHPQPDAVKHVARATLLPACPRTPMPATRPAGSPAPSCRAARRGAGARSRCPATSPPSG